VSPAPRLPLVCAPFVSEPLRKHEQYEWFTCFCLRIAALRERTTAHPFSQWRKFTPQARVPLLILASMPTATTLCHHLRRGVTRLYPTLAPAPASVATFTTSTARNHRTRVRNTSNPPCNYNAATRTGVASRPHLRTPGFHRTTTRPPHC
jgi:hypothetical protein